ncbi:hypothetical protein D3C76_1737580 [compost metagenome]
MALAMGMDMATHPAQYRGEPFDAQGVFIARHIQATQPAAGLEVEVGVTYATEECGMIGVVFRIQRAQ